MSVQTTLSRQEDILSSVQLGIQQLSRGRTASLDELEKLKKALDAVMQEVLAAEALREHIGEHLLLLLTFIYLFYLSGQMDWNCFFVCLYYTTHKKKKIKCHLSLSGPGWEVKIMLSQPY